MKYIKQEMMTIVFIVCFNIMTILSRNKIEIPSILKFFVIILDIIYSFYLGRLYELGKLTDAMQNKNKQ